MCDLMALPHCGHLFSSAACQRFAALRVRNRIFEVLRFGTPIEAMRKAGNRQKTTCREEFSEFRHGTRFANPSSLHSFASSMPVQLLARNHEGQSGERE